MTRDHDRSVTASPFPFDGMPLLEQRELVRELVDLGYTDLWSAESGGYDAFIPLAVAAAVGTRAAARHRDRPRVHARRAHARVDRRVDVPGRARAVRARARHVVERHRRALERHRRSTSRTSASATRSASCARALTGEKVDRGVRDVRGERLPARHPGARAAADPRRRAAPGHAAPRRPRGRRRDHQLALGRRREDGRAARRSRARRSSARIFVLPVDDAGMARTRSASARSRRTSPCPSTPRSTSGSAAATSSRTCGDCGRKATARPRPSRSPTRSSTSCSCGARPSSARSTSQRYIDNGVTTPAPALFCGPDQLRDSVRALAR